MNIRRKKIRGFKYHQKWIRLSDTTIKILIQWLQQPEASEEAIGDFFTSFTTDNLSNQYKTHFKRLQEWYSNLKNDPSADPKQLGTLKKLLTRLKLDGKPGVTPHQFRHSWKTFAVAGGMKTEYTRYHLNHKQEGADAVYLRIDELPQGYWENYDRTAPKFHYDFSLAKQVYPELHKCESVVKKGLEIIISENTTTMIIETEYNVGY